MNFHTVLSRRGLQALTEMQSIGANHKRQFTLALAYVLTQKLPVPVEPMDDVRGYFRIQHQIGLTANISRVNELLPHNVKQVQEDARALFSYRYDAAHPVKIPLVMAKDDAVSAFFHITKNIPPDMATAISENPSLLTTLIMHLGILDDELSAACQVDCALGQPDSTGENAPPLQATA